jgi:DNA-directed RNA polymerase subunit H
MAFELKKILEHDLVPEHKVMKKTEVEALLKQFGISMDQLPKMKENDPVVQVIGAKKGDVLKILRKSPTAGESMYYRLVT